MPQIGWFELLIVVLVAILVIGPKDFPIVLRKVGSWIGTAKRYFSDILATKCQGQNDRMGRPVISCVCQLLDFSLRFATKISNFCCAPSPFAFSLSN